ncbi:flagellar basal body P-ring formation protein FlgA [Chitinimonas arctica]|uniref:Flagella basal body P-ring formation protein FlgA n=1 Tax=Chitinimonas arctica TaxID=2594795 RepID=A0A516SA62_9NEIS|nr:flagellar basal body P-ring formation chaperone FlgA [Chitinimonas arctica]QDQ25040.1 flagellar basal body P-ring formation protein FlgA [Chitinimonas arctica]
MKTSRHSQHTMFRRVSALFLLLCSAVLGAAETRQSLDALSEAAGRFLSTQLANYGERASFQLGRLDNRLELAPCQKLDVQLPQGSRLVGNTSLRIACGKGAKWVVSLPVAISIQADYWVATRALPAGHELTENDIERRSGDLSQLPSGVIIDHTLAIGRTLLGGTPAGAPLRGDQLRPPFAVKANEFVKIVATGNGFEVASEGRAMANANEGQQVSVKMVTGAVVQGVARAGGTVEIKY